MEASHYFIPVDLELLKLCLETSRRDTWAKVQLLIALGASNGYPGDWMKTAFLYMRHPLHTLDQFQTLCSFLHSGVVDIDAKDSRGLTLYDLLQEDEKGSSDSQASDMLHCAVEREARFIPRLQNWILKHPRKPSHYSKRYTPFHHLCCLTQLDDYEPLQLIYHFRNDLWPDMTPEEEHTVAHGCYAKRDTSTTAGYSNTWIRWSSSGEVFACDLEGPPDEAVQRQPISFPCTDCIARWLHDTGSPHPRASNGSLSSRGTLPLVATSTGVIWDLDNTMEDYPTYAWVPAPSSDWSLFSGGGVQKYIKTVHIPRLSEVLDSDIHMQQDQFSFIENVTRHRTSTTSSSGDEDRVYKRPRLDD